MLQDHDPVQHAGMFSHQDGAGLEPTPVRHWRDGRGCLAAPVPRLGTTPCQRHFESDPVL